MNSVILVCITFFVSVMVLLTAGNDWEWIKASKLWRWKYWSGCQSTGPRCESTGPRCESTGSQMWKNGPRVCK